MGPYMERQLSRMKLFSDNVPENIIEKMEHAPLTNSGRQSKMADLDVRVRFSGGSAPITTISDKQNTLSNRSPGALNDIFAGTSTQNQKWRQKYFFQPNKIQPVIRVSVREK